MNQNKLIIDLDNTITIDQKTIPYKEKLPNNEVINTLANISQEYDIQIFTARNMQSLDGDINKINEITKPIALEWLNYHKVNYKNIQFGKPYCGNDGFYIDDKNLSIEEFIFKFNGPFTKSSFDIIVPFYNESDNIIELYKDITRLNRLFNVKNYILVNNGSNDDSIDKLDFLKTIDDKIKIVNIKKNVGYGYGIKSGLLESEADYVIINHSDLQFDTYSFYLTHLKEISKKKPENIFSIRTNRTMSETTITLLLRFILSILRLEYIKEFNGQPKLLKRSKIADINKLPDDFSLDFVLYKLIKPTFYLPIIQKNRKFGTSTWNINLVSKLRVLIMYIKNVYK